MDLNRSIILGIGNDILKDDGIGPKLVRDLQRDNPIGNVQYKTVFLGGLDLLDLIRDYQKVIFIDAIKTKNGTPGMVYTLTPDDFKETLHLSNFHDTSFLTALELGKQIGIALPEEIHIIAIEIVEDLTFGDEFSPQIAEKFPAILVKVNEIISQILIKTDP